MSLEWSEWTQFSYFIFLIYVIFFICIVIAQNRDDNRRRCFQIEANIHENLEVITLRSNLNVCQTA